MEPVNRPDRSLAGRCAIITGAGSGIGRACAHLFAEEGTLVAVTGRSEKNVMEVVEEIKAKGGKARGWILDVGDAAAIKRVVDEVAAHFGRIDIIVNNAGIAAHAKFDGDDFDAAWDAAIAVMLTGPQRMVRAALPYLRKSDAGRVVNIGSVDSVAPISGHGPYGVAKTGLLGLTRVMALELARDGITANCVNPGLTHTALNADMPMEDKNAVAKKLTVLRRWAQPEEMADAILNISRPSSGYMTGATVTIDGGWTIRAV